MPASVTPSKISRCARLAGAIFLALATGVFAAGLAYAQRPPVEDRVIEIKLADLNDDNPLINYRKAVIELAMKASGKRYTLVGCQITEASTSDRRFVQLIQSGQYCNLMATSAGSELTRGLEPIPFPIYLGGGGYRVLLANHKSLDAASAIRSLDDLRKFRIGSGTGWVDTSIMQANGLTVVQGSYMNLFEMLKAQRFDFYNRSVFEAAGELENYDPQHQLRGGRGAGELRSPAPTGHRPRSDPLLPFRPVLLHHAGARRYPRRPARRAQENPAQRCAGRADPEPSLHP